MNRIISKTFSILLLLLIAIGLNCFSAAPKYRVSEIPKNLLAGSKAVIRKNEVSFEISGIDKAVEKVVYAITILNDNGIDNSMFIEFYNKFLNIRNVNINLYDQNGNEIHNLTQMVLKDYSAISGYSIYEDNRVKYMNPNYRSTPFTVEYTYEINFDGLLSYPEWKVYTDYNVAVESSKFKIITPAGFKFRYIERYIKNKCLQSTEKGKSVYSWEADSLPALREEPFSYSLEDYTPVVYTAPNDFEIDGYTGNSESWDNFGKWISELGKGRNQLNPETQKTIQGIVSGLNNDSEKINALYKYMQDKVRYVSVQVGIGGWQPIEAETVNRLSYGDCKALANYMKSLLDIAGIKNYYTLVNAGEDNSIFRDDFPSNQFNHAIVCVPLGKDTTWLECTSQHLPCGYIGTFTDDRKVLIINSEGGKLVRTKVYSIENNQRSRTGHVYLSEDGSAKSDFTTDYKGLFYDHIMSVTMMDEADKKKDIQSRIPVSSFTLSGFSYKEERSDHPVIREQLNLALPKYCSLLSNKVIFNPNPLARESKVPFRTKERISPILVRRSMEENDTIYFSLPDTFKPENLPPGKILSTKFGEYSSEVLLNGKMIKYVRAFKLYKGSYPVKDYNDFVSFFEKITIADESKVSILSGK
jgi:transglutaminase-like putative cysteine protease